MLKFALPGIVCLFFWAIPVPAQSTRIDKTLAAKYFREFDTLVARDGGKLWGKPLCPALMFVDPKTREVVANRADREGKLRAEGEVFFGTLPPEITIANTSIEWGGVRWAMVRWPLPEEVFARASLMAHEAWHCIQPELGLPSTSPDNGHLDIYDGRVWLQIEWRALAQALTSTGARQRQAIRDALTARDHRRALFPDAARDERSLEMHEGLAEYTGLKLSGRHDLAGCAVTALKEAETRESFVRSFAYASGPAYGLLLDQFAPTWRTGLKPSADFGALLRRAVFPSTARPLERAALRAAARYGAKSLIPNEKQREADRLSRVAEARAKFVDGPVVELPLRKWSMTFNPGTLTPIEGLGTVYPGITVSAEWGVLTVEQGALVLDGFSSVRVSSPSTGSPLRGEGWKLDLKPGWRLIPGRRPGDFTLGR